MHAMPAAITNIVKSLSLPSVSVFGASVPLVVARALVSDAVKNQTPQRQSKKKKIRPLTINQLSCTRSKNIYSYLC